MDILDCSHYTTVYYVDEIDWARRLWTGLMGLNFLLLFLKLGVSSVRVQVVERGFSALAVMAQTLENRMLEEVEDNELCDKWETSRATTARAFSVLLQQAWLPSVQQVVPVDMPRDTHAFCDVPLPVPHVTHPLDKLINIRPVSAAAAPTTCHANVLPQSCSATSALHSSNLHPTRDRDLETKPLQPSNHPRRTCH
ncbi:hypothetical protein Sjap_007184 [Stephania japonica]|uniref:Uncharacterized protein n=1 Tax=Stephania japonica TaxID=461633 RepID=A0AAP0JPB7_9MAGN